MAGGPGFGLRRQNQQSWVPRPCVLCKGGHDAAERVSFDLTPLSRSSGSGAVPEVRFKLLQRYASVPPSVGMVYARIIKAGPPAQ